MTGPAWTPEEDAVIAELYPTRGEKECAKVLGRSERACSSRAKRIGVRSLTNHGRSNPWTDREERVIVARLAQACRETGRSPMAVIRHSEWLLRKAKEASRHGEKEQEEQEDR